MTVLGMGAMGSRMAANLIRTGHGVTVWNRDPSKTAPLVDAGARAAATPRDAARDADVVIAILRDDKASKTVWLDPQSGALAGMRDRVDSGSPNDAVAIESSTVTAAWARALADHFDSAGIAFLDAPVAGSRPQAEAAQLIYLVGGDAEVLERVRPVLETLGSTILHAGPSGSGSAVKLMINSLLGIQVAALGELIGFAKASGLDVRKATEILTAGPVASPAAKLIAGMMLDEKFAPLFPVELVEKDLEYAVRTANGAGTELPVAEAARRAFEGALDEGYGDLNMTAIVKRYV